MGLVSRALDEALRNRFAGKAREDLLTISTSESLETKLIVPLEDMLLYLTIAISFC